MVSSEERIGGGKAVEDCGDASVEGVSLLV